MKKLLLTFPLLALYGVVYSQTGPGGIGSSTNNLVWFDANSLGLANGAIVSTWFDVSGNSNNLTGTGSSRPTNRTSQANGFPAIDFDGGNDFMRTSVIGGFSNDATVSYIFVMRRDALSQSSNPFTNSYGNSPSNVQARLHGLITTPSDALFSFSRSATSLEKANHDYTAGYQIHSTIITSTDITAFTNGLQITNVSSSFLTPVNHKFLQLGRRPYLDDLPFSGRIAEVIAFNDALNTTQLRLIENYLSSKYAISIDAASDHYAMEGTGHYFNVTGIGMEGGNAVNNAEGGSGVQINNPSALSNGDYLLWGHNNASLTVNSTNVPAEFADFGGTRLNRTWGIDETNDVGTVTVTINMNGMPALGASTNDYVLMFDDDGDFSNGGTTYHTTGYSFAAGIATWTGVDFPDNSYFTVAYVPAIFSVTTGNWNTASTWNCNCVPTSAVTKPVFVSSGDIVTVDAASSVDDLNIVATGTLSTTTNNTLTITGNLTGAGTVNSTNGVINMNGSTAQTISVSSAQYFELTINNAAGVTVTGGTHAISTVLTVTAGNFNVGNNLVTLQSIAAKTARIAPSNGTISGNMIVQRFISARSDGFSTMSSPVTSATFAEWDDDIELLFVPYSEFHDAPSIWDYDETVFDFIAVETSATPIVPGEGYEVYLDNDGATLTSFNSTTLDVSGTPNMGNVTVDLTVNNDGWNLIGNPYASFISWSSFQAAAGVPMNNTIMYYNEVISDYSTLGPGAILSQSQGFWVEATSAGTATFHESDKSTSTSSAFRSPTELQFSLRVSTDKTHQTSNTYFNFDMNASTAYVADHDLTFLKVPSKDAPALYTHSSDGKKLRINELAPEENMVIPVDFIAGISADYTITAFNIDQVLIEGFDQIILEDKLLGIFYDLKQGDYNFSASINDKENRFNLHLKSAENTDFANETNVNFVNSASGVFVNFNYDNNKKATINVFNVAGQEIIETINTNTDSKSVGIQIPKDYQGMYIIRVIIDEKVITQRFYKN